MGFEAQLPTAERVLQAVLRHGWNATSCQILARGLSYFFHGDGCVAYVDTGRAWVAAGVPLVPEDALAETTAAFLRAARARQRRCCFVAAEERFVHATRASMRALPIGEQPEWDPATWPAILARERKLREQLRRARAKGVTVRLLAPAEAADPRVRAALRTLHDRWLATRRMSPMGFLVDLELDRARAIRADLRRCFVAERAGEIVAVAYVLPVPRRHGWFIEHFLRDDTTPNGTIELLFDAAMRWAAAQGSRWLTLGLAPLTGDVSPWLRRIRRHTRFLYDFDGLRRFKAKLRPATWQPIHVVHPPSQSPLRTTYDVLVAFSNGGLLRFGACTLARHPGWLALAVGVLVATIVVAVLGTATTA